MDIRRRMSQFLSGATSGSRHHQFPAGLSNRPVLDLRRTPAELQMAHPVAGVAPLGQDNRTRRRRAGSAQIDRAPQARHEEASGLVSPQRGTMWTAMSGNSGHGLTLIPSKYSPILRPFLMHAACQTELPWVERSSIHAFPV